MKNFLFLLFFFLVFECSFGQSHITRDTVFLLTVNDDRIYQVLDSVCEKEKKQTYFTDTSLSIYMDITFCYDSNHIELGKVFVVDVYFRETAAVYFEQPIGVFAYRGFNVFVEIHRAPFVVFCDLFPYINCPHPEPQMITIYRQEEFPKEFIMLKKNDNKSQVFTIVWNFELEINVIYGGDYIFNRSRYTYDQGKFHFIDYKPIKRSTF